MLKAEPRALFVIAMDALEKFATIAPVKRCEAAKRDSGTMCQT
jgi:hypothetical protein